MSIVSPTPGCSYKPVQVLALLDWLLAALELMPFFSVALSLVLNWSPHRSGTRSDFLWRRVCGATWLGPMPCGTTSWRHKLGATNSRACPGLGFSRGFMLSFLCSDHRATPTSDRHCSPPSHCSNEQCACHQACGCCTVGLRPCTLQICESSAMACCRLLAGLEKWPREPRAA